MKDFLPILLQVGIVLGFGISALLISVLLGKSAKRTPMKDSAYECGMLPQGGAQPRFTVKFYLVAMLFILFDIEVVFLYPWAVNFKYMLTHHGTTIFLEHGRLPLARHGRLRVRHPEGRARLEERLMLLS